MNLDQISKLINTISELWKKKLLIYNFSMMDLKIRYRNSILGFLWTVLEPLLILTILYLVFTNIFDTKIDNFPLYILLGLILWNMFQKGTTIGLNSLVSRSGIITQIYFPREIPAISASLTSLYMVFFEIIIFGLFLVAFQFTPSVTILILPLIILLEFVLLLGTNLALSVLNARFKDIQFIWAVVLQGGFFLTPIFYKLDILPEPLQQVLYFSPLVHIVEMAHDVVLYDKLPSLENVGMGIITSFAVLLIGYLIFRKMEPRVIEEL